MEVDGEMDQKFLQQFRCLGTTDKEELVMELKRYIGPHINDDTAAFFLDMSDWNLQDAICSYFDVENLENLPSMTFIRDDTIGEGESIPPNTKFTKKWELQNSGTSKWPAGCILKFSGGVQMARQDRVILDQLQPGERMVVCLEMTSPGEPGIYEGKWRVSTATGSYFGDVIWVIVTVSEGGTLALMQQLSQMQDLGSPEGKITSCPHGNPFYRHLPERIPGRRKEDNGPDEDHQSMQT